MAINFYYIDDDPRATIVETAKGLSIHPERLIVTAYQHETWDKQLNFIIGNQNDLDGLMMDWSLNNATPSGEKTNYNVEALAQQLRRLIIDDDLLKKDFPIVLCSANFRFKESFSKELSSQGLFDLIYEKDDFDVKQEVIISQLEDIANGYKKIKENRDKIFLLKLNHENELDYRINDFLSNTSSSPIHDIAQFILHKLVIPPGPLISEHLFASRLGIDIISTDNEQEWDKIKGSFKAARYEGIFSSGWERWWAERIYSIWEELFDNSLGSLSSQQRVNAINHKFGLNLRPFNKEDKSTSDFFWVISKKSFNPLAIEDAIIANSIYNKTPWEEDQYFSINEALDEDLANIHPIEKERVKKLKEAYTQTRTNA